MGKILWQYYKLSLIKKLAGTATHDNASFENLFAIKSNKSL